MSFDSLIHDIPSRSSLYIVGNTWTFIVLKHNFLFFLLILENFRVIISLFNDESVVKQHHNLEVSMAAKKKSKKKAAKKKAKKRVVKKKAKKKVVKKKAKKKSKKKVAKKKKPAKKKKAAKKKKPAKKKKVAKKKVAKKKAAKKKPKKKRKLNPALMKTLNASDALASVVGSKKITRQKAIKHFWDYVKKKGLQDSKDRRQINIDDKLIKLFGNKKQVSMFEATKVISKNLK